MARGLLGVEVFDLDLARAMTRQPFVAEEVGLQLVAVEAQERPQAKVGQPVAGEVLDVTFRAPQVLGHFPKGPDAGVRRV